MKRCSASLIVAAAAAAAAAKSLQLYPTLCDPIDGSPTGSSAHEIFQARVLEWGATNPAQIQQRVELKYNQLSICFWYG